MLNLVVMLPKPGPAPAERAITLTAGIYRLVGKLQRKAQADFESGVVGFWDTALRGSDALRAALLRVVRNEIAVAAGFTAAEVLFDIHKFFDGVRPSDAARLARRFGYPLRGLALGLQ
eukprot:10667191-Alexandrium_andersonii.AAC.1